MAFSIILFPILILTAFIVYSNEHKGEEELGLSEVGLLFFLGALSVFITDK